MLVAEKGDDTSVLVTLPSLLPSPESNDFSPCYGMRFQDYSPHGPIAADGAIPARPSVNERYAGRVGVLLWSTHHSVHCKGQYYIGLNPVLNCLCASPSFYAFCQM